ncbi:hypothetical protein OG792_01555 [Micromonospora sp. NBC_01699]|uniref:hypothetical protein n=1 Tax=Micromonospora sp. NBC_01699 TaxID=2975984 RepID=UPI002E295E53|nr:hypothetical protein [Micromonospora sp. NBC_01699]
MIGRIAIRGWRDDLPLYPLVAVVLVGLLPLAYLVHRPWERPVARWLTGRLRASFDQVRAATA